MRALAAPGNCPRSALRRNSKLQGAEAQRGRGRSQAASDESTYQRLKAASTTPGVVAE